MADNWRDFPLPDGSYSDDTRPFSQQDVVNYLPTFAEGSGTTTRSKYTTVPGLDHFTRVGTGPHRAARDVEGKLFVVSGRKLYQVKPDGTSDDLGVIPGTAIVTMSHNQISGGNEVLIGTVDNSYIWNTVTETLTATGVPLQSVDFLNQRFLGIDQARRFWRYSGVADGMAWDVLDNESAESSPDRIMGGKVNSGEWLVFGERTIEVFTNAPNEATAFVRATVIEKGCANASTIQRLDNSLFFVGNDSIPYRLNGYSPQPIAPKAIVQEIASADPTKLISYVWEDRGYVVYYITARDGRTWGYDVTNGKWHRRQSFGLDRWRINTLLKWNGAWYGGDFQNGKIYRLDWDSVFEGCEIMPRRMITSSLYNASNRVTFHGMRIIAASGKQAREPRPTPAFPPSSLLVTGSATGIDDFTFATVMTTDPLTFAGIPTSTGANISSGLPAYYGGKFAVVNTTEARISSDNLATWQSGSITTSNSVMALNGGPAGWLAATGLFPPNDTFCAGDDVAFTNIAYSLAPGDPGSIGLLQSARQQWRIGNYYYRSGIYELYRTANPAAGVWNTIWISPNGTLDPTLLAIVDATQIGGTMYATAMRGYYINAYQVRTSPDGGATWPDGGILVDSATDKPIQIIVCGEYVVAFTQTGKLWTSANGWASPIATGLAAPNGPGGSGYGHDWDTGRRMASDGTRVYIIGAGVTGDQCVSFNPATLTVSAPVTMPIANAWGIASSFDAAAYADYELDACTPMESGTFQLRYSNDGAENWSNWRDFAAPTTGSFLQPLVARRLGMARHRTWEIMDTSDRPQDLLAASLIFE